MRIKEGVSLNSISSTTKSTKNLVINMISSDLLSYTKDLFTPSESGRESEKDQRTTKKDQRINDKPQSKCSLSLLFSLAVNGP